MNARDPAAAWARAATAKSSTPVYFQ